MTNIELKADECAIIFGANGPEIVIPRMEEDETVGMDILTVCAIAHAVKTESKLLVKMVEDFQKEMKIQDAGEHPVSASAPLSKIVGSR